jgi:hypothetical protein
MRGRILLGATVALAVVVVVILLARPEPYGTLRQTSPQAIPGTLGYTLLPPGDVQPALTPAEVQARYPADGGEVAIALATIHDDFSGRSFGPGWVLFARGVCLRDSKGELVSDARGTDPSDLACTDATIWILAVDPATAAPLIALTAHDADGTFAPTVGGA